jgi:hypothetical protein
MATRLEIVFSPEGQDTTPPTLKLYFEDIAKANEAIKLIDQHGEQLARGNTSKVTVLLSTIKGDALVRVGKVLYAHVDRENVNLTRE